MNKQLKDKARYLFDVYSLKTWESIPTGSYFLDLMVCPDLDVYIPLERVKDIFLVSEAVYKNLHTEEIYVMKGKIPDLAGSHHIQVRTNIVSGIAKWKIDIWILTEKIIEKKQRQLQEYRNKLDNKSREEILAIKRALINKSGFTPKYSSFHVYEAYFDHGIRTIQKIKEFLAAQNIVLDG